MGIAFPGHLAVFVALVFNFLAGLLFLLVARGHHSLENLARYFYHVFALSVASAVVYLFYLFFSHNFAVKYVVEYSDRSLPFLYLVSAFWGGQAGTYLLWLFFNVLCGYIILCRAGRYRNYAMAIWAGINFFFLWLLLKVSPFAAMTTWVEDGAGLNPLLQDPWMIIHPPVIFVGYAMAGVPFAIALAALILNDYSEWVRRSFPWIAVTALMLGAGNVLGGYWAYKTLGWGGYWAWDPVENSSFVPWFVALALIHGLLIEKRSGALRKTNILMTALVFILVVYGTFLTRSGVLADFSVHSFVDLGINNVLIAFLVFFAALTVIMFVPRVKAMGHVPLNCNYYGREFMLLAGMLCLLVFSLIVIFWSSLPILTTLFADQPRAAGRDTYNGFALPLAVIFSLFLAASPFTQYLSFTPARWRTKLILALAGSAAVGFGLFYAVAGTDLVFAVVFTLVSTGLIMFLFKPDLLAVLWPSLVMLVLALVLALALGVKDYMYLLYLAAAAMVVVSNLIALARFLPERWRAVGGLLTHFGFGLLLIGVLGSSALGASEKVVLPRGQAQSALGWTVSYNGMAGDVNQPGNQLLLTLSDGSTAHEVRPELYYSARANGVMRKPFIKRLPLYDVYLSPEEVEPIDSAGGVRLAKGESGKLGAFTVIFKGFDMVQMAQSEGPVRVAAMVEVADGDSIYQTRPAVEVATDADGKAVITRLPDKFGGKEENTIVLNRMEPDQGTVVVDIPGSSPAQPPDRLILDVSVKPMINLVWLGTTLILVGAVLVFLRRRSELTAQ